MSTTIASTTARLVDKPKMVLSDFGSRDQNLLVPLFPRADFDPRADAFSAETPGCAGSVTAESTASGSTEGSDTRGRRALSRR
ncbi:MAG: hypothetical protein ACRDTW_23630, partial [Rhodococcus qingshengii]